MERLNIRCPQGLTKRLARPMFKGTAILYTALFGFLDFLWVSGESVVLEVSGILMDEPVATP